MVIFLYVNMLTGNVSFYKIIRKTPFIKLEIVVKKAIFPDKGEISQ